jgi:TonB family protein
MDERLVAKARAKPDAIVSCMRNLSWKTKRQTAIFSSFALLVTGVTGLCLQGQASASSTPSADTVEMPRDPDALMLLAAKFNGLTGEDNEPWHLKASYTVYDDQGAAKEQGAFEEFWAGPQKSRTTYTVGAESVTIYSTATGNFRTGSLAQPNGQMLEVVRQFVDPLPAQTYLQHATFEMHTQRAGASNLNCVQEKPASGIQRIGPGPEMFCFNLDKPVLRIDVTAFGARQAVRNSVVLFQGTYVPQDIRITIQDKTTLTAHLESLESIASVEDADFVPPADAKPLPKKIAISPGVANTLVIKSVPPHYPPDAKAAGISGTVVIQIRIGTDGHVYDAKVVSGQPPLRQAALDAVEEWVYRPYRLNGEAVEVDTIVNVVFNLAR